MFTSNKKKNHPGNCIRIPEFNLRLLRIVQLLRLLSLSIVRALSDGTAISTPHNPSRVFQVCGSPDIPLHLLKSVATYKGVEPTAPLIQWFWEVMESFSNTERSLFLRFVWGRTRLPRTIADFRGRDFVVQVSVLNLDNTNRKRLDHRNLFGFIILDVLNVLIISYKSADISGNM